MAVNLSKANIFGVHSILITNLKTGATQLLRAFNNTNINIAQETIDLNSGSYNAPLAIEDVGIELTVDFTSVQFLGYLYEIAGFDNLILSSNSEGAVVEDKNIEGDLLNPSSGIDSISITASEEANLKMGLYTIEAVSPTTVDIYVDTDKNGKVLVDDTYKINATPITITDEGDSDVTDNNDVATYGLTLTGGTTVGMNPGDKATFRVFKAHDLVEKSSLKIGNLPNVSITIYTEDTSEGSSSIYHIPNAKSTDGLDIGATRKEFAELSMSFKAIQGNCGEENLIDIYTVRGTLIGCEDLLNTQSLKWKMHKIKKEGGDVINSKNSIPADLVHNKSNKEINI